MAKGGITAANIAVFSKKLNGCGAGFTSPMALLIRIN
jgi:hypothetical protein